MVLVFGHTLRAHEALSRPDALPGFLEVVHRLFEDGVYVSHDLSIRGRRHPPITRLLRLPPRVPLQALRGRGPCPWLRPSGLGVPHFAG